MFQRSRCETARPTLTWFIHTTLKNIDKHKYTVCSFICLAHTYIYTHTANMNQSLRETGSLSMSLRITSNDQVSDEQNSISQPDAGHLCEKTARPGTGPSECCQGSSLPSHIFNAVELLLREGDSDWGLITCPKPAALCLDLWGSDSVP